MSHQIPEPFAQDEAFRVFYENLDKQNASVFKSLFSVAADRSDAHVLANFVTVANNLVANEDARSGNDEFVKAVNSLTVPVSDESLDFVKKWLVNHIKGVDTRSSADRR